MDPQAIQRLLLSTLTSKRLCPSFHNWQSLQKVLQTEKTSQNHVPVKAFCALCGQHGPVSEEELDYNSYSHTTFSCCKICVSFITYIRYLHSQQAEINQELESLTVALKVVFKSKSGPDVYQVEEDTDFDTDNRCVITVINKENDRPIKPKEKTDTNSHNSKTTKEVGTEPGVVKLYKRRRRVTPKRGVKRGGNRSRRPKPKEKMTKCETCNNKFYTKAALLSHIHEADGKISYKCGKCGKLLKTRYHFTVHHNLCGVDKSTNCYFCQKRIHHYDYLQEHMRFHTDERITHKCEICGKTFLHHKRYKWHKASHKKPLECYFCGKTFPFFFKLTQHLCELHTTEDILPKCEICGKRNWNLSKHKRLKQGDDTKFKEAERHKSQTRAKAYKKRFKINNVPCYFCKKVLCTSTGLENHLRTHTLEGTFWKCEKCPRVFASKFCYEYHQLRNCLDHDKTELFKNLKSKRVVGECEKCGKFSKNLPLHKTKGTCGDSRMSEGRRCRDCGISFSTVKQKKIHDKQEHGGQHTVKCEQCNKEFTWKGSLRRHIIFFDAVSQKK